MLRRRLAQVIVGLGLLANGSNVLIFTAAGVTRGAPLSFRRRSCGGVLCRSGSPVTDSDRHRIGFGVLAFSLVLARRFTSQRGRMTSTDRTDHPACRRGKVGPLMLLALPILLPLMTAVALQLLPHRSKLQRLVAFGGALAILTAAIGSFFESRGRDPGYPGRFVASAVRHHARRGPVQLAAGVDGRYPWHRHYRAFVFRRRSPREAFGYHALIHVLLMGVSGAFLTGDIFNLYVWFEVMLIASFVLMSLHRTRAQLHAAFTYVGLNLLASAFLLTAIGLLYGRPVR